MLDGGVVTESGVWTVIILESTAKARKTDAGTPAFSTAFASCRHGDIACAGMTVNGSATGQRYSATLNGVIDTAGGGATELRGSVAGAAATGGQDA